MGAKGLFRFIGRYGLSFILIFELFRLAFIAFNWSIYSQAPLFNGTLLTFFFGLRHDISMISIILLPVIIFMLLNTLVLKTKLFWIGIRIYTFIVVLLITLFSVIDAGLYPYWKYRLDSSLLDYIDTPSEMLASADAWQYILAALLVATITYLLMRLVKKVTYGHYPLKTYKFRILAPLSLILLLPFLFLTIRGGWGVAPVNVGSVYFHPNTFVNHAAINPLLSFFHDLSDKRSIDPPATFFTSDEAEKIFLESVKPICDSTNKVINKEKPNVLIILLESFGAPVIKDLGGNPYAAPNMNRLTKEGIFFDNFYASGPSSRKGLVAILSGYPAQPKNSIISFERKVKEIPHLAKLFNRHGYQTFFLYGGNLDFAHMNSYLKGGGFEKTISVNDFLFNTNRSKWGIHDEVTFERLYEEIMKFNNKEKPFFGTYFSLSSHEPYDVPTQNLLFDPETKEGKYYNAVHYTDSCLGLFINQLKANKEVWDNTLCVLVADHSCRIGNAPVYDTNSFKIPMLWIGGAIENESYTVSLPGCQTDIYNTLSAQIFQYKAIENLYGKDLFSNCAPDFAFFTFNNGFSLINQSSQVVYDNYAGKFIYDGNGNVALQQTAKAYYQFMMDDYLEK